MSESVAWTLERGEPFMSGHSRYRLRREGMHGIRGSLTLLPEEALDIEARLTDPPGVVRVDTTDKALVERLAEAIYVSDGYVEGSIRFSELDADAEGYEYMRNARAVLAALQEAAQ